MYAPHFGAALAIKGRSPGAPLWTLFVGAFIRDLVWIAFARMGIEPAQTSNFFDDWSHSLVSVAILATLFASVLGRRAQTERRSSPPATRDATKGVCGWVAVHQFTGCTDAFSVPAQLFGTIQPVSIVLSVRRCVDDFTCQDIQRHLSSVGQQRADAKS